MADVGSIEINGVSYDIKDGTARINASSAVKTATTAKSTADSALAKAGANETEIANIAGKTLSVSYSNEKITFTKGV